MLLSCAIAPAQAVERNWRGSGEVLILPFFNSLNGWDTYLNLSMLPYERGIFRLRILDGDTGRAVNGFNIYSYWSENWRASITQVDGGTVLRIAEGSCTLAGDGTFGGAGTEFALGADVGIVEVYAVSRRINSSLREETCDDIAARWEPGGAWAQDPDADLRVWENSRVGGQVGLVQVQVQSGLSAEYQAIALSEFADDIAHTHPASGSPSLADAAPIARLESGEAFTQTRAKVSMR
ncbi:MAG: hypothetical protein R3E54_03535 [Halioglobus sp.]